MGELLDSLEALYGPIALACYRCGRATRRTVVSKDETIETGWCGACPHPEKWQNERKEATDARRTEGSLSRLSDRARDEDGAGNDRDAD